VDDVRVGTAADAADERAVDRDSVSGSRKRSPTGAAGRPASPAASRPGSSTTRGSSARAPDVAEVVEELHHPERPANLIPAERGRGKFLVEVPREVERIHAVEHAEVVGLAPDDLLAAGADRERDVAELQVDVGLAELVVELEGRACAVGQAAQAERPFGEAVAGSVFA
jgi:hypothetical protein